MTYTVYLLKLVQDKWYVGTTPKWRKDIRYDEHTRGIGSQWTSRYPPINVVDTWDYDSKKEAYQAEDDKCCEYLNRFGIDSCRGGLQNFRCPGYYRYWVRKHLRHLVPADYDWNS